MAHLKICTIQDLDECVRLMSNFISSSEYATHLDVPYAAEFARKQLCNPDGITIGIENNGNLAGMLSAVAMKHPFILVLVGRATGKKIQTWIKTS